MLPLMIAPQPILRQVAQAVPLPISAETKKLAQEMGQAMLHYRGIGLAAPQVNQGIRLIVIATTTAATAYVNPEIIKTSWRKIELEEGCLSLPGVYGLVRRPARVLAKYYTLAGELKQTWLTEMVARIYQHEIDHLNGVLFVDKTSRLTAGQELLAQYGLD